MTSNRARFIALYVRDVREYPETYKEAVQHNPEHAARVLIAGLDDDEIGVLLRDLRRERRAVAGL
jgi:hypothetical protein